LTLCGLSRTSEDLRQARRLLSLACVYDGMSRADAAKGGGVARQSLRDRGHRFNEAGPEGLFDRRVPRPQMRMRPLPWAWHLSLTGGPLETTWPATGERRPVRCCLSREDLLHRLLAAPGFSRLTGRPQHPAQDLGQDPGLMEAFKKTSPKALPPLWTTVRQTGRSRSGFRTRPASARRPAAAASGRARGWDREGRPISVTNRPACPARCAQTGRPARPWCCHSIMGGHWNKEPAFQGDPPGRCKRRSGRRPDGPRAGAHIRRGEGAGDPDPDLPARQITGAQSGREGLAIPSGERALQPPLWKSPRDWTQNGQTWGLLV